MSDPLGRVLARLPTARRTGRGWRDRCPVHGGESTTSLSLALGDDGRVLLHCHAGCPPEAILATLGLATRDLFPPPVPPTVLGPSASRATRRDGSSIVTYDYVDADGTLRYQTVRRDPKGFFQRRPDGRGGWIHDLTGVGRVLYRLPELLAATGPVWLPEGEKDADALASLGLTATTTVGGANAPWLASYTEALRGHHVALLADNDDPGRARVQRIVRALLGAAASVRIVDLPDLPPKGDVSDWLAAGGTKDALLALARATPPLLEADLAASDLSNASYLHSSSLQPSSLHASPHPVAIPEVLPFPVEVFPAVIRRYVEEGAAALGVPVDMVAVPLLAFAAGAIGNTRALRVKAGWVVRPILWLAVIGEPGSGKSPALDHARHPLDVLQRAAWETFRTAMQQWELDAAAVKAEKPPAPPPPKPVLEHFFTTDATTEALAAMLGTSPGLALVRDELVGWVKSHDAYRKGGDRQNWLSLWAGAPLKVDRRGAGALYVPRPTASVVGGIQPELLSELAEEANRRDGFVDRFGLCWPDAKPARWTEATVDGATTQAAEALFARLRPKVPPDESRIVDLAPGAKRAFAVWFDENADLVAGATGLAAGCAAKLPGQCARIALVLHGLHHPHDMERAVAEGTVLDAIAVVEYFRAHLARVLPAFGASGAPGGRGSAGLAGRVRRILQDRGGGWIPRTELHRQLGGRVEAAALSAALTALAAEGRATTRSVPTGARAREEWRWVGAEEASEGGMTQEAKHEEKHEDMKNCWEDHANASFLHIFGANADGEGRVEGIQETLL